MLVRNVYVCLCTMHDARVNCIHDYLDVCGRTCIYLNEGVNGSETCFHGHCISRCLHRSQGTVTSQKIMKCSRIFMDSITQESITTIVSAGLNMLLYVVSLIQ